MNTTKPRHLINSLEGQIIISEKLKITKQTAPLEIIEYFTSDSLKMLDIKNGWIHYSANNLKLNDKYFNFRFTFFEETLKMISFTFEEEQSEEMNWNNWNEEKEKRKKKTFEDWLRKEIGDQRKFDWGTIESYFDNKGGFSSIVMNYK